MDPRPVSPKRAEAARYRKIADELDAAALEEETKEMKAAQETAQQTLEQAQQAIQSSPTATAPQAPDTTGSGVLDQILGHNGY